LKRPFSSKASLKSKDFLGGSSSVSCGFLSNPDEAALYEGAEYRSEVAQNITYSISEFLKLTAQGS
jgi:hypothetical protein